MVSHGSSILYSAFLPPKKAEERMHTAALSVLKSLGFDDDEEFVDLIVSCDDEPETGLPPVRVQLK